MKLSFLTHLKLAWQQIGNIYLAGKICSERHLQAELFHQLYLNPIFLEEYELRVEPCMYHYNSDTKTRQMLGFVPDMLIVSRKHEILACIELKYVPHGFVPFKKDIKNMCIMWKQRHNNDLKFYLDTAPESGDWNYEGPYTIGENFQLFYGLIGNEMSDAITNYKANWIQPNEELGVNYRQLIGSISKNKTAEFYMTDSLAST